MQESRYDGTQILTNNATSEQITDALGNLDNESVSVHRPGSIVTLPKSGAKYRVGPNGNWIRIRD